MSEIGKLFVEIGAKMDSFNRDVNKVKRKTRDLDNNKSTVHVGANVARAMGAIDNVLLSLAKVGVAAAAAGTAIGVGLGVKLGMSAIEGAANWEKYGVILANVMAGGKAAADDALAYMKNFAKSTPYELDELVQGFVKLTAYGIDAKSVMQTLGDTASSMGKDFNEAVEALADAQTGEFERLKEFGIKALDVNQDIMDKYGLQAEAMGKTVLMYTDKAGKEQVKVVDRNSREMVTSALMGIWNERYAGGMDKLSQTLAGKWSNIKDSVNQSLTSIGLAIMPTMKNLADKLLTDVLPKFQSFASKLTPIWEDQNTTVKQKLSATWEEFGRLLEDVFGTEDGQEFKKTIEDIGGVIKDLGEAVRDVTKFTSEHWGTVKPILEGLAALWIAVKVQAGLAAVAQAGAWIAALGGGKGGGGGAPKGGGVGGGSPTPAPGGGGGVPPAAAGGGALAAAGAAGVISAAGKAAIAAAGPIIAYLGLKDRIEHPDKSATADQAGAYDTNFWPPTPAQIEAQKAKVGAAGIGITASQAAGMAAGRGPLTAAAAANQQTAATSADVFLTDPGNKITTGMGQGMWGGVAGIQGAAGAARGAAASAGNVDLTGAGAHITQTLINGMESNIGPLRNMSNLLAQTIRDSHPHSPAKTGPLSGKGAPIYAGISIGQQLARGMAMSLPLVQAAANAVVSPASNSVTHNYGGITVQANNPQQLARELGRFANSRRANMPRLGTI